MAFNKDFKSNVQDRFDEFMEKNFGKIEKEGITVSEKRVIITKWVELLGSPCILCQKGSAAVEAFKYSVNAPLGISKEMGTIWCSAKNHVELVLTVK